MLEIYYNIIQNIRTRQFRGMMLSIVFHAFIIFALYSLAKLSVVSSENLESRTSVTILDQEFDDTSGVIAIEEDFVEETLKFETAMPIKASVVTKGISQSPVKKVMPVQPPQVKRSPFQKPKLRAQRLARKLPTKKSAKKFSIAKDLGQRSMVASNENCEVLQRPLPVVDNGLEGQVRVRFIVDSSGTVSEIRAQSRPKNLKLSRAVRRAVSKWKFRPGQKCRVSQNFVFK